MHILITGGGGQLGLCLSEYCDNNSITYTSFERSDFDISNLSQMKEIATKIQPSLIINAAAYTLVDAAETNIDLAFQVNEIGPHNLAILCNDLGIPLIHVSTDYVFDGTSIEPYTPNNPVNPINEYGKSKLAGEQAIERHSKNYFIVRTSCVFSEYGKNFFKTILSLLQSKEQITIISNQYITPTYAKDLAEALIKIALKISVESIPSNTYHFGGNKTCSWYDFAKAIFQVAAKDSNVFKAEILPILSDAYPQAAKRPMHSSLDSSRLLKDFGISSSDWIKAMPDIIENLDLHKDK